MEVLSERHAFVASVFHNTLTQSINKEKTSITLNQKHASLPPSSGPSSERPAHFHVVGSWKSEE